MVSTYAPELNSRNSIFLVLRFGVVLVTCAYVYWVIWAYEKFETGKNKNGSSKNKVS